ncbi:MAG: hypothetical protein NXI02_27430, partial [Rhodobacteraceae bacterium]|nr:hypothetical protein [Paracoccaceae bacterium]
MRQDLARIHQIVRIERLLDCLHHFECITMFPPHVFLLALADTVFAGAGAAHGDRPQCKPSDKVLRTLLFFRIVQVDQDLNVE